MGTPPDDDDTARWERWATGGSVTYKWPGGTSYGKLLIDDPHTLADKVKLTSLLQAEVDAAYTRMAQQLSQDLYGPKSRVRWYLAADHSGVTDAASWVGKCSLCGAWHVANLDPAVHGKLPDGCETPQGAAAWSTVKPVADETCLGLVLASGQREALLAAFTLGGYEALRGMDP